MFFFSHQCHSFHRNMPPPRICKNQAKSLEKTNFLQNSLENEGVYSSKVFNRARALVIITLLQLYYYYSFIMIMIACSEHHTSQSKKCCILLKVGHFESVNCKLCTCMFKRCLLEGGKVTCPLCFHCGTSPEI